MFYSAGTLLKKKRETYNRSFQFIVFAKSIIGKIGATKMFEIVDNDDCTTDAGAWVSYKLTHEPSAQVSKRL